MKDSPAWQTVSERVLVDSPVMSVVERGMRKSTEPESAPHRFYVLRSRDWCNIIPVTEDGNLVLVRQHRAGIDASTLEIPGGVVDPDDASLEAGALREMTEETGYAPLPGARCEYLGWSYPNPAIQDNRVHGFVVGPVRRDRAQKLDAGELIEVVEIPIAELPARITSGEISHALMLNTFLFLALRDASVARALTDALTGRALS